MTASSTQRDRLIAMLAKRGMARLSEIRKAGITAATVSRLEAESAIVRLSRGLYQLPGAPIDAHHSLAEAAKRAPKATICFTSALVFHELTDQLPRHIWMAIRTTDWKPRIDNPAIKFVRFNDVAYRSGVEEHTIENVTVKIYKPAKTIVDLFRFRQRFGLNVALEGLRAALRQRKATPAEIAKYAVQGRVWSIIRPYLEAMTADG